MQISEIFHVIFHQHLWKGYRLRGKERLWSYAK